MKTLKIITGVIIACFFVSASLAYASGLDTLRVRYLEGSAQVRAENTSEWVSVLMNMPLMEGDELRLPESGRMEIQTSDGSFLRLDGGSSLAIPSAYGKDYRFSLSEGRLYVYFKGAPDSSVRIETPGSFARASQEAKFSVDLDDTGMPELSVFRGTVYAAGSSEMIQVRAGETLILSENYYADITPLGPSDEWERWNRDRDYQVEERVRSARYLPDELQVYSSDLDDHGEWVYVRRYGYVWKPYIIGVSGWSPYRAGKWAWFDDDYVWISYEPWGWAPYHYGRWAFTVSTGWFWVPPSRGVVYWGPGYVGWIRTPAYIAWVPLAPGDIYYAYGHYGPGSVNIINVNINIHKKLRKRMYRNVKVDKAVIAVHRDSFASGRYKKYKARENLFIRFIRPDRSERPDEISFLPFTRKTKQDPRLHIDTGRYLRRQADRVNTSLKKTGIVEQRDRKIIPFTDKRTREEVARKRNVPEDRNRAFLQTKQSGAQQVSKKYLTTDQYNAQKRKTYGVQTDRKKSFRILPGPAPEKVQVTRDAGIPTVRKTKRIDTVDNNTQGQGRDYTALFPASKSRAGMRRLESQSRARVDFFGKR